MSVNLAYAPDYERKSASKKKKVGFARLLSRRKPHYIIYSGVTKIRGGKKNRKLLMRVSRDFVILFTRQTHLCRANEIQRNKGDNSSFRRAAFPMARVPFSSFPNSLHLQIRSRRAIQCATRLQRSRDRFYFTRKHVRNSILLFPDALREKERSRDAPRKLLISPDK